MLFFFCHSAIRTDFWPLIRSSLFLLGKLFIAHYWHFQSCHFIFSIPLLLFPEEARLGVEADTSSKHMLKIQDSSVVRSTERSRRLWHEGSGAIPACVGSWGHHLQLVHSVTTSRPNVLSHLRCEHLLKTTHAAVAKHQHQNVGNS